MKLLRIIVLFFFFECKPLAIICDLGGVFIETNKKAASWYIGPTSYLYYLTTLSVPTGISLKKQLFAYLNTIEGHFEHHITTYDSSGLPVPSIMAAWLAGASSCNAIQELINQQAKNNSFFSSHAQKLLIHKIANLIFDPAIFVQTRHISRSGTAFLQECKRDGHQLYILSNWDPESFALLERVYPDFFALFDGKIISGEVGLLKPDPTIYQHLLETFDLNPSDCLFIDDQMSNIHAAESIGMRTVHYQKKNSFFGTRPNFESIERVIQLLT